MNRRFLGLLLPVLFAGLMGLPRPLHSQTTAATISGQIVDSTGAIVRGAAVELRSTLRGTSQSATTNSAGIYVFPTVDPGPYAITVRRQGFRQVDLVGLVANVQDHIEQNFKLEVGSVTESVTVEGNGINFGETVPSGQRRAMRVLVLAIFALLLAALNRREQLECIVRRMFHATTLAKSDDFGQLSFQRKPPALGSISPLRRILHGQIALLAFLLIFLASPTLKAQTTAATISGQVVDAAGALVRGAQVELKATLRGTTQTATTNAAGIYVFPSVDPGPYSITVRRQGFRQVDLVGLVANVQDHIEQNFKLEVGSVTESVTVEGNSVNINKSDGSVSTVVDAEMIKNMPLNGRSFQDLILLTPGVVTNSPQSSGNTGVGQSGEFSVNGQRTESNYYTVDGVSANVGASTGANMFSGAGSSGSVAASTVLGTTQALVSVDALQEFRVQSSTYSAEYGRSPGGQFAFETKSGTNQWQGTIFDYIRNGFFDAQDWFNDYLNLPEPSIKQNDFGGTLGGPFKISKVHNGKEKTFFFVSYEGLRLVAPQPATINYVPDLCMRGSMSACAVLNAQYAGTPAGTAIGYPSNGRASAAAALLPVVGAFPLPSANGLEDAVNGIAQFIGSWSNPSSIDSTSVRFDHAISDGMKVFFRWGNTLSSSSTRSGGGASSSMDSVASGINRTYTVGTNNSPSPALSNEFRLNYSSNEAVSATDIDTFDGGVATDLRRLTGLGPASQPIVFFGFGRAPSLEQAMSAGDQRQWNFVDSISFSVARHQMKFGFDYRRLAPIATPNTPDLVYDYFSENAVESNSAYTIGINVARAYPLYRNFSAFAEDEWRVSPRLMLSLGLRWEVNPSPGVARGIMPYTVQGTGPDNYVLAPEGTPLWHTAWLNFAPRLGGAYVLRKSDGWETVLRAGGGVFFDTGQQLGSLGFSGPGFSASAINFATPMPFPAVPQIPPIVNPPVGQSVVVYPFAPNLQLPYTLQWNGSIEQALGNSQALSVSYVGSRGSRLLRNNIFQPANNPTASQFNLTDNGLTSDYQALQLQLRRRMVGGLTALTSYTWSHCLDFGSVNLDLGYQRGNCDFDIRQSLAVAFAYDLPNLGHDRIATALFHHWGVDGRFSARTAFPVLLAGEPTFDEVSGNQTSTGLNLLQGQPIYLGGVDCESVYQQVSIAAGNTGGTVGCPGGRAINPCAFEIPSAAQPTYPSCPSEPVVGLVPRNLARGFGVWQMDSAVRREFSLYESLRLQFRAEAFNVFNHPSFGVIDSGFGSLTFGQATGTLASSLGIVNPLYQQGGARSMQFALKLIW